MKDPEHRDDGWVASVEEHYRPAPLDAKGAARFDAKLRERIEASAPRRRTLAVAWAAPALAAAIALAWWVGAPTPAPAPESTASVSDWAWELLVTEDEAWGGEPDVLPEDYAALAMFLDYGGRAQR